jgi:hypothetical protein
MKTTSLQIIGAILGLSMLGWIVPRVGADEDYVTEINRYVDKIYQDQKARDDYMQSIQDGIDQVIKQRDEILNSIGNGQPEWPAADPEPAVPAAVVPQPAAPVAGPVGGAAQAPPVGAVPAFRQRIFNGPTRTDVTYYRVPGRQPEFTSVSVNGAPVPSQRRWPPRR